MRLHRSTADETLGCRLRAFTLVEVMVVVVIIGLLAAAGLPGYRHLTMRSKVTALENDLRQFSTAIQTYALQSGHWPDSFEPVDPSSVPEGLKNGLPSNLSLRTPIGGYYSWTYAQDATSPGKAYISIQSHTGNPMDDDIALLEMIDKQLDDGNIKEGLMQEAPGSLVYVIEK